MCNEKVPIYHKVCLTIEEASEYSNIGINKMQSIAANPRCSFVLYVDEYKQSYGMEVETQI